MKKYPIPANEAERLEKLASYDLIGLGKDPDLDVFAQAAGLMADCPVSLIAMMEKDEQAIQSCVGLSLDRVDRKLTVCQYTIMTDEMLVIPDTLQDERTADNPLIQEGKIRFYAGLPLLDEDAVALGTLCVIDFEPKTLSAKQVDSLKKLAEAVTRNLLAKKRRIQASYYGEIFKLTKNIICVLDTSFIVKDVNPAFESSFALTKMSVIGRPYTALIGDEAVVDNSMLTGLLVNKAGLQFITTTTKSDGSTLVVDWYLRYHEASQEVFGFGRNITSEREKKEKLERSERRFRNFFEHAIGLMSIHDMDGNILSVNEKGRNLLQYSEEEVRQLNLTQLVPEHHIPMLKQYLDRIKVQGEDSGMMVLQGKDNQEIYWLYQNMLERDENDKPYVMSTALNMTDRIKLERDLLYTKKILEQTNAVARVGGWEVDFEKSTVYWSESAKDVHGVDSDFNPDFETAFQFFEEESQEKLRAIFSRARTAGESSDEELRIRKENGKHIWVRIKVIPEVEDGICKRVFGIIQDIDESKRLYLELARKEAMLQAFVHFVPASAAMFDRDLNFVLVSQQWINEFHKEEVNIINQNLYTLFPNAPEERRKIYNEALQGHPHKNTDLRIATDDHLEVQHYNWEVRPWMMADGSVGGIIILVQNITESVHFNEKLKEAKNLADLASRAKSEFLANMSHEIRTPLNGVIGFSDLLLKTPLNDIQKQYLNYINESGSSLLSIINDILDFSKIESGKLELFIDQFNLYDLGHQVINVVLYQAQRKEIELLLNMEQGLPAKIWIDESRIKQVLINLLGNAVKFTEQGEIELKVEKLASDEKNISLRFTVRDTGIGIPADKQQRIFDAFTQEDSSVSKRYGGTGLGLTISNNILRYMGSELSLESNLGKGSTFHFDITVAYEETAEELGDDLAIDRVLIVDDNQNNRIILQHMLAYRNIWSEQAANGMEALQLLMRGERFDVILMDYHMPILSGLETVEKIKELFARQGESIPLIVLHTSSEEHEVISTFQQQDHSFCLLKPIKSQELYATLRRVVQQKRDKSAAVATPHTTIKTNIYQNKLRVLLADDNQVNMALNVRMMRSLMPNALLVEVNDGAKAIERCKEVHFDLILMDVQMPAVDGIEATKTIRTLQNYANVPIIAVTAGNVFGERDECIAAGMTDFLPKPFRQHDLQQMLMKFFSFDDVTLSANDRFDEHVDRKVLDEQVGNDQNFRSFFLGLVLQEITTLANELAIASKTQDNARVKSLLHKLRGTAGTAGLFRLVKLTSHLEKNIDNIADYQPQIQDIQAEIAIAATLISAL